MKSKTVIFSALLFTCGAFNAVASDCIGDGCATKPLAVTRLEESVILGMPAPLSTDFGWAGRPTSMNDTVLSTEYGTIPTKSIKTISIKPVPSDTRAPLWDGNHTEYKSRGFDKTVDWQDGVPVWDDSISNYKDKDFRDWFLEPMDTYFLGEMPLTAQTPATAPEITVIEKPAPDNAVIRDQIEGLLIPYRPAGDLWSTNKEKYKAQDLSSAVQEVFEEESLSVIVSDDGCPFETDAECAIWRRKPMVRETVSPRSPKIRATTMNAFIQVAQANNRINASVPEAAPLVNRYKMLMQSAQACCTDGMAYALRSAGATDGLVYKFLSDDANFYGLGDRCLMMTDTELDQKYPNTATAAVAADVRNGCLCRGRQWFQAMLAPFEDVYKAAPEFAREKFNYTYTDGLQRDITVSINTDVKNVLNQLALCP